MFSKSYKSKVAMFGSAALALTVSASSHAVLTLLPNGAFDASADMGVFADFGGGSTVSFETTGGNPDGYGLASNTAGGWGGGFVAVSNAAEDPILLSDYGWSGGDTVTFQFDMIDFDPQDNPGANTTGIKVESWTATAAFGPFIEVNYDAANAGWNTYTYSHTFEAGATHFKAVLIGTNNGAVGFDNFMIDAAAAAVPVPAAAWLFGSALAGLVAARRRK